MLLAVGVLAFGGMMIWVVPQYLIKPVAPVGDMRFLDLYREDGFIYVQLDGVKQTNDRLGGIHASWRFSDLTMISGGPVMIVDGGPAGVTIRVAGERFISAPYRVEIDPRGSELVERRLATDDGAQFRLCLVYPQGAVQLQCFEVPANEIPEGPFPVPGISQTIPTVTFPRVVGQP